MPKHRFRLQKVMEAKQCAEDQKKQALAAALRVLDREERTLLDLHSLGEECRREVLERPAGRVDVAREQLYRARFNRLMRDISRQAETVEHSRRNVSREREALVECSKERKILEKLKEKGLIECMRQWLRKEQKETDEAGRYAFLRRPNKGRGRPAV